MGRRRSEDIGDDVMLSWAELRKIGGEGLRRHSYIRPHWECAGCREPWPCDYAKGFLLAEYLGRHPELALYLGMRMTDFVLDSAGKISVTRADAGVRFLGWLVPLPPGPALDLVEQN